MAPAQEGKCVLREGTPNGKGSAHGNERAAIRHRDRAHGDHLIERGEGRRRQFRHAERPCRRRLRRLPCRRRRGTHLEGDERFQPSDGEEGGRAQEGGVESLRGRGGQPHPALRRHRDAAGNRPRSSPRGSFRQRQLRHPRPRRRRGTHARRCARSPTSWPARRSFSTARSGLGGAASSHRYANRTPSKRCRRNAATSEPRLSHRRETWDFDMDDTPRAPATSSTLRAEMPSTHISATAATSARSARQ